MSKNKYYIACVRNAQYTEFVLSEGISTILRVQQRQRSICIVVHVYIALMLVVDVVSKREPVARTILLVLFLFFFLPLPTTTRSKPTLSLFRWIFFSSSPSLPFRSFSLLVCSRSFSFLQFFFFLRVYMYRCVLWRPWTDDHVHIAAATAMQMKSRERERASEEKERNGCNDYYCLTVLFHFFPFFVLSPRMYVCMYVLNIRWGSCRRHR